MYWKHDAPFTTARSPLPRSPYIGASVPTSPRRPGIAMKAMRNYHWWLPGSKQLISSKTRMAVCQHHVCAMTRLGRRMTRKLCVVLQLGPEGASITIPLFPCLFELVIRDRSKCFVFDKDQGGGAVWPAGGPFPGGGAAYLRTCMQPFSRSAWRLQ